MTSTHSASDEAVELFPGGRQDTLMSLGLIWGHRLSKSQCRNPCFSKMPSLPHLKEEELLRSASVPCAYCCSSAQEIHQLTAECGKGALGCFDRSQGRGERENCLLSRSVILYLQRPLCSVSPITMPVWFGFWFWFGLNFQGSCSSG